MKFEERVSHAEQSNTPQSETKIVEKNLPSGNLPYPDKTEVFYSPYTFLEIKRVSKSTVTTAELFKMVLSGIEVRVGGVAVDNTCLTVSDFLYLALMRKLASFGGNEFTAYISCENCGEDLVKKFKITDLDFIDLATPAFPVNVKLQGQAFSFSPTTVREYLSLDSYTEIDGEEVDREILEFAIQVENREVEDAYRILGKCTSQELETLRKVDSYLIHSLKDIPCSCTAEDCGYTNQIELDAEGVLIVPFREKSDAATDGISFG